MITRDGKARVIKWVGNRRVDCGCHPAPHNFWPVRILAHAFGPGRPHRNLLLSPDHAVYADGVLIPARYLINGTSIAQLHVAEAAYYHVEPDQHDVIVAEGLQAETYLDTANRASFACRGETSAPWLGNLGLAAPA